MKKFISVLLAILMVVAVMPFAIFAADEADEGYVRAKNTAHICHPVDEDGNLVLDALSLADTLTFTKVAATDVQVLEKYLTDGNKSTATRLPVGATAKLTITFAEAKDLGTLTLTVNGSGKINPGEEFEAEVIAASKHNLKIKVVAYNGTTKVYEDAKEVDTTELTDLVVNIFEKTTKIEITTVGAADATKGGPRLWEVSATTVKGEKDYVHDYEQVITKAPTLYKDATVDGTGKAYDVCKNCGDKKDEYVLPALTKDQLTGGKVTLDDIESFEEILVQKNPDGSVKTDDDGNKYSVDADAGRKPEALFDGDENTGGAWNVGGSYWNARNGGQLVINMKREIEISYFKYRAWGSWMAVNFEFYKGDALVAAVNGGANEKWGCWVVDDGKDMWYDVTSYTVTKPKDNNPLDYITAPDAEGNPVIKSLTGVKFDKIVITMINTKDSQRAKIGELEIGTHQHVYDEADVKKGTQGTGEDTCKWTHTSACVECHEVVTNAITYLHAYKKNAVREVECGTSVYYDTCTNSGCKYNSGEYEVAGTGAHDYSTYVVQNTLATCGAKGKASFICSVCKEREEASDMALVGKKLAADVYVGPLKLATKGTVITEEHLTMYGKLAEEMGLFGDYKFLISATDAQTNKAVTVEYAIVFDATSESVKYEVGVVANGYHTVGYKNIVPSTYTAHGVDGAYCTVCGVEFKDTTKAADLKDFETLVRVTNNGFTLRTTGYEGIRATYTINKQVLSQLEKDGYSVRIWSVVTNGEGVTKELQIYGAGSNAWIDILGKTSVVVKGVDADEVVTFQIKISVKDKNGEQVVIREAGSTTLAEVKAAGK